MVHPEHPANHVVPFGSPGGETPRFVHTPGQNMRIAQRRADGGWDFIDPRGHIAPSIFDPDSPLPSPSSTIFPRGKDVGMKLGDMTNREFEELGGIGLPPPAYYPEEGYISKA